MTLSASMSKVAVCTTKPPPRRGVIPLTGQFVKTGSPLSRRMSPKACTIVAAFPSAGNILPSLMRRKGMERERKNLMISRGGHSRMAGVIQSAEYLTSRMKSSLEMSFVKLHLPLAVIKTFAPRRALRSIRSAGVFCIAAETAANMPAAPPPIIAIFTLLFVLWKLFMGETVKSSAHCRYRSLPSWIRLK